MNSESAFIIPDWPVPGRVRAMCTTRLGGVSSAPWDSLNLGSHVGDDPRSVDLNRQRLANRVGLPFSCFQFMEQVHGTGVAELPLASPLQSGAVRADGCVTSEKDVPCLVMVADCLPVLFCNRVGTRVAAAHAGWRGLCNGVLEHTVGCFDEPSEVMAWLGPAIGPRRFEVGAEVRDAFLAKDPQAERAFRPTSSADHFMADLYELARQRLNAAGIASIYGGNWCTFSESERFFSFRRDGDTGRMASLIFIS